MARHPRQPVELDDQGVPRFKSNKIVRYLLEQGPFDMNHLALQKFSQEDKEQFAQLIGYSVSGFGDLSYAYPGTVADADNETDALLNQGEPKQKAEAERLQEIVATMRRDNIVAHTLAMKMNWRKVAEVDKALAVAVLTTRDRIPFEMAYEQVFGRKPGA